MNTLRHSLAAHLPESGHDITRLLKDPTTKRYSGFSLRSGSETPQIQPALEIDVTSGRGWYHGSSIDDVNKMLGKLRQFFSRHGLTIACS
ncbi:MAG: hypothetical protein ACE5JX_13890 [Acidobacteriota bacterium]